MTQNLPLKKEVVLKTEPPELVTLDANSDSDNEHELMAAAIRESRLQYQLDEEIRRRGHHTLPQEEEQQQQPSTSSGGGWDAATGRGTPRVHSREEPAAGLSMDTPAIAANNPPTHRANEIPHLYQVWDPNWTLGSPLSADTLDTLFNKQDFSQLATQLKNYLEYNLPQLNHVTYPGSSKVTEDLSRLLYSKKIQYSPVRKDSLTCFKESYFAYLKTNAAEYKDRTIQAYMSYMFTGKKTISKITHW